MHRRTRWTEARDDLLRRLRRQPAENSGSWTRDDLYDHQEEALSTKSSIKYHNKERTPARWFHLYNEVFATIACTLSLAAFRSRLAIVAISTRGLASLGFVSIRIPNDWRETSDAYEKHVRWAFSGTYLLFQRTS
jgi:hypothetical protein